MTDFLRDLILISDPRVVAIPAADNAEPLVDLRDRGFVCRTDERKRHGNDDWVCVRQGVAERLVAAQQVLPQGVRFLIAEGYRPLAVQERYYDEHLKELRGHHPDWGDDQLAHATALHVAPPEAAAHCTGGAVDLTLCDADGTELDLGTAVNATPEESDMRCFTNHPGVVGAAAANHQTLIDALTSQGFINYPSEWWHWSFGDRYWAFHTATPKAVYGPTQR